MAANQDAINKGLNDQIKQLVAVVKELTKAVDKNAEDIKDVDDRIKALNKKCDSDAKSSKSGGADQKMEDRLVNLESELKVTHERALNTSVAFKNLVPRVLELEKQMKAKK